MLGLLHPCLLHDLGAGQLLEMCPLAKHLLQRPLSQIQAFFWSGLHLRNSRHLLMSCPELPPLHSSQVNFAFTVVNLFLEPPLAVLPPPAPPWEEDPPLLLLPLPAPACGGPPLPPPPPWPLLP